MIKKIDDIQQLMIVLQKQLRDIDRQLKKNDLNIERMVKKLSKNKYILDIEQQDVEIKIRSYQDDQYVERVH